MAGFLESLDCVELVDEAPEIARHFSRENGDVLKRKNVDSISMMRDTFFSQTRGL